VASNEFIRRTTDMIIRSWDEISGDSQDSDTSETRRPDRIESHPPRECKVHRQAPKYLLASRDVLRILHGDE